jgi:hypothetical protein
MLEIKKNVALDKAQKNNIYTIHDGLLGCCTMYPLVVCLCSEENDPSIFRTEMRSAGISNTPHFNLEDGGSIFL